MKLDFVILLGSTLKPKVRSWVKVMGHWVKVILSSSVIRSAWIHRALLVVGYFAVGVTDCSAEHSFYIAFFALLMYSICFIYTESNIFSYNTLWLEK